VKHQRNHPHQINDSIQFPRVLVLDQQHQPLGIKPTREALAAARQVGLDLILVSPKAIPPVCLIGDYGKFLYEHNKQTNNHKQHRLKEIQLSPNIFQNDRDTKARQAKEFLAEGHSIKVVMKMHGREKAHPEIACHQMEDFLGLVQGPGRHPMQHAGGVFISYIRGQHINAARPNPQSNTGQSA
jgi:translation initiation factor IF-3